jgi:adenosylhomocysteine nucleosidase
MLLLTCPPATLAKGGKSCHTRVVSDLFLIVPTAGEYRVVEAVVQRRRLPVDLRMCGMGPRRAAAICAELERGAQPRGLALLGWAGGLRADLVVGDIVIADWALSAGRSDVNCLALPLPGTARVHRGPVLTADHVVAAPAAKRAAAACGALAVEMEAYPLAAWAAQHAVPFVHGRVILDTVDDALPALDGVLDGYGHLQIRPLLGALARRPALLSDFTRMALRLRRVNRRLAELAKAMVAAVLRP